MRGLLDPEWYSLPSEAFEISAFANAMWQSQCQAAGRFESAGAVLEAKITLDTVIEVRRLDL